MSQSVFVVLFRGINVGGNRVVRMEALRGALTEAGFGNVTTYIQSGNVVLTWEGADADAVADRVEQAFAQAAGFSSRPSVRSLARWQALIAENPFPEAEQDGKQVHAVLLDAEPPPEALEALRAFAATERIEVREGVLYLHTPDGFGRSRVAESLDRALKVPLTARNWNTVLKLQAMAEAVAKAG